MGVRTKQTVGKPLKAQIKEMIGRTAPVGGDFWSKYRTGVSVDRTITRYEFWDKFRRGLAKGYEFAGAFARPIIETTASWVMGDGIGFALADNDAKDEKDPRNITNWLLNEFSRRYARLIRQVVEDLYALGDQYVIVNPDGTLSVPSPDTVEVVYAELDYRRLEQVTVVTHLETYEVRDVYRDDLRTVTIKNISSRPQTLGDGTTLPPGKAVIREFDNLIGRIPVVHFANDRGTNETHGRPIYEGLKTAFSRYDDLIMKMIDGAELMGNPFPVFEGMDDIDTTVAANSTDVEEIVDNDGVTTERPIIDFAQLSVITVGKGGGFKFASPQSGFTNDVRNTLKSIWLLVMEFSRLPEAVWGGELSSARATAGEQMRTFYSYITGRRLMVEGDGTDGDSLARGGLLALVDIWLRTTALINPVVVVGPVAVVWPELSEVNEELTIKKAEMAHNRGVLTDETFLSTLDLVDNPADEVMAAAAQQEERRDPFDTMVDAELEDEA